MQSTKKQPLRKCWMFWATSGQAFSSPRNYSRIEEGVAEELGGRVFSKRGMAVG